MIAYVSTADGRRLAVEESGDPGGHPVFFMHGTPGSRVGPLPPEPDLWQHGVRLISFDRPGYGYSDRRRGRLVADVAADVAAIADELLGIGRQFAVIGRSGGGPHALACAALLPTRVTRAAALVSLAPWDAVGLDWFRDMARSNVEAYTTAYLNPGLLGTQLMQAAENIRVDPASHLALLEPEMPEEDQRIVADGELRTLLAQNYAEALRNSADGWVDDVLAFCSPWGFDVAAIRAPVLLWHGGEDVFSPVSHTYWLAKRIPEVLLETPPDQAHFGALKVLPHMLSWLTM